MSRWGAGRPTCAWRLGNRQCLYGAHTAPNFPEEDPVLVLCNRHLSMMQLRTGLVDKPNVSPRLVKEGSYVYFIQNGSQSQVKIGRSTQPETRISRLGSQAGVEYTTLLIIPETQAFNERTAHIEASRLRIKGEWFEATVGLLDWIDRLTIYKEHGVPA